MATTRKVSTQKEFYEACKASQSGDFIEFEGEYAGMTVKVRASGKGVWVVGIGLIATAVAVTIGTGGLGALPSVGVAVAYFATFGVSAGAVKSMIALAVISGGVGILNSLRDDFEEVYRDDKKLILRKK